MSVVFVVLCLLAIGAWLSYAYHQDRSLLGLERLFAPPTLTSSQSPGSGRGFELSPEFFLVLIVGVWGVLLWDANRRPDPRTGPLYLLACMFVGALTAALNLPKWRVFPVWRRVVLLLTFAVCISPFLQLLFMIARYTTFGGD